MKFIPEARHVH